MKKDLRLCFCSKLNCKLTKQGCLAMQKRSKLQKDLEHGIVNAKTIRFLIDPLPNVPCPCQNPIARV